MFFILWVHSPRAPCEKCFAFFVFAHFPLDWVDKNSNLCMHTSMQFAKLPFVYLVAGGWYLDCSYKFMLKVEKNLNNILVGFALEVTKLEAEPEENNIVIPSNEKEVVSVKGKGKGRKDVAHASFQVSTCVFHKCLNLTHCCSIHHRGWKSNHHSFNPCP
jgi:hypothetical protein